MSRSITPVIKTVLLDGQFSDESLAYSPKDPEHFCVQLSLLIGEPGDEYCDSFDVLVCTPSWLAQTAIDQDLSELGHDWTRMPDGVATGTGFWFMRRWDPTLLWRAIMVVIEEASPGPDWDTVAARIGRFIPWEFDYKHDQQTNAAAGLLRPGRDPDAGRCP